MKRKESPEAPQQILAIERPSYILPSTTDAIDASNIDKLEGSEPDSEYLIGTDGETEEKHSKKKRKGKVTKSDKKVNETEERKQVNFAQLGDGDLFSIVNTKNRNDTTPSS